MVDLAIPNAFSEMPDCSSAAEKVFIAKAPCFVPASCRSRPPGAEAVRHYCTAGRCLSPIVHRPGLRAVESKNCGEVELVTNAGYTSGWKRLRESAAAADTHPFQPKMICTKKETSSGSPLPVVSMMQAAGARERDQTRRLARLGGNRAHCRCVFLKRIVGSIRVIIGDVIADQTTQMSVIVNDRVIEKLSATASIQAISSPGQIP
jgi:hypothetical protein